MKRNITSQTNVLTGQEYEGPWYKQFWAWFVLLPLVTVVAMGGVLLYVAITGSDSIVVDDYYKEGLAINQRKNSEILAVKLAVKLTLWVDDLTGEIRVEVTANKMPDFLNLYLYHPTLKANDTQLQLKPGADGAFYGHLKTTLKGKWYLFFDEGETQTSNDEKWRIKTEMHFPMFAPVKISAGGL